MNLATMVGYSDVDAPEQKLIDTCIHCGLCLNECPTYRALRFEMDSPRGRIQLMKAVKDGRMSLTDESFRKHIFLCLDCRGCETACPSGVRYGPLVEAGRAQLTQVGNIPKGIKLANFVLRNVFAHPRRFRLLARVLRFYQRSGLQWAVRKLRILQLVPGGLAKAEQLTPRISERFLDAEAASTIPPEGPRRFRVGFLTGCIMSVAFAEVHRASLRVLARNGCEVVIPKQQVCCGALSLHNGDRHTARELARRNIEAFEKEELDAIVVNSAGCASTMKEWGEVLKADSEYAQRAEVVAGKIKDFSEWLAQIGLTSAMRSLEGRVTYQEACHLRHAQKIAAQPRKLIGAVPGAKLIEMRNSHICCGNAGIYSALNTDLSLQILDEKLDSILATGAATVITTNPGCQLHIRLGLAERRAPVRIVHIAEFLDEAYGK